MTGGPLLAVRDLTVTAGAVSLVRDIALDVPAKGVVALLGRNGAGKTTTLRGILGLAPRGGRVTGSVCLDGGEQAGRLTHQIVRSGIGYVAENRGLFGALTVAENLRLAEPRHGEPDYDRVFAVFPELKDRARQRAGTMSGGQQQMLALGRVLLGRARLLLVDEPTKGLAPKIVTEVAEVLAHLAEAVPILLVEQKLAAVRRLARTAVVLTDGHVAFTGAARTLMEDPELVRSLLGVGSAGHTREVAS
ncbi:ABC transporter ATP-binding protein [Catenulispora subtropica]|uniref:ABC transporter ATP-binding protein n=1 Tax=Catenulispora subtropica TaxID=450798 RepID=A0ABP5ELZ9_9ACTN